MGLGFGDRNEGGGGGEEAKAKVGVWGALWVIFVKRFGGLL